MGYPSKKLRDFLYMTSNSAIHVRRRETSRVQDGSARCCYSLNGEFATLQLQFAIWKKIYDVSRLQRLTSVQIQRLRSASRWWPCVGVMEHDMNSHSHMPPLNSTQRASDSTWPRGTHH